MGRKIISLLVLTALILNLFLMPSLVKAAGSVNQSRGHFYFNWGYEYAMNGTDETPDTSMYTIENFMRGSVIEFPVGTDWTIDIPTTRAYLYCDNWGDPNTGHMLVYEIDGEGNAGTLLAESTQRTDLEDDGGNEKYGFNYQSELGGNVSVSGEWGVYVMAWAEASVGSTVMYAEDAGDAGTVPYGGLHNGQTYSYGNAEDPAVGESLDNDRYFGIWAYLKGRQDLASTVNVMYGTPDNFTALRVWSVDWGKVGVSNTTTAFFTHPVTEKFLNLTVEGVTLNSSQYTLDNYNATHDRVNIPDSTFNTVWDDSLCQVSLYTGSYDYKYIFSPPAYENGTDYPDPVIVTAHIPSGNEEINVTSNGCEFGTDEEPEMFSWDIGSGYTRRVYSIGSENITVTIPPNSFASYGFTVRDYTGQLGQANAYLESIRIINGEPCLIERMLIQDTANQIPLTLIQSQIYTLRIRFMDDSIYSFGTFIPGSQADPTLSIYDIDSSEQLHYIGEDVTIEFSRPTYGSIKINYEDAAEKTTSIFVEICNLNGTQVWNETATESSKEFNWNDGQATLDYLVNLVAQHPDYEEVYVSSWLAGLKPEFEDPPDFDALLGKGASTGFALFLIVGAYFLFSRATALLGIFFATAMTYVVIYVGFLDMSYLPVHVTMALVIMWGLSGGSR